MVNRVWRKPHLEEAMTTRLHDGHPPTAGWHWKQTHWDNYRLTGPAGEIHDFRTYGDLCWWCGSRGLNATQV